jgi:hypothetical protein
MIEYFVCSLLEYIIHVILQKGSNVIMLTSNTQNERTYTDTTIKKP